MVFPLGWGVMGAALATSIACVVGGVMVLAYFVRFADKLRFYPLKWTLTSLLLTLRNTGYIFFDQHCLYRILSEHRESDGFHRIYAVAWHIVSGAVFPLLLPRAFGVYGLWLAIPVAELMTCTVISLRYILRNFSQRRAAWMVTNGKE
jgi:Na+-driven multidrug efflux pump